MPLVIETVHPATEAKHALENIITYFKTVNKNYIDTTDIIVFITTASIEATNLANLTASAVEVANAEAAEAKTSLDAIIADIINGTIDNDENNDIVKTALTNATTKAEIAKIATVYAKAYADYADYANYAIDAANSIC